ncbi:hypothetical protein C2E21_1571 [Chlorella sorokiniana]|uniref:Uncharacterized protein n=1 Tax=Chlorella sorokiniana TaxID=3076 RepID=A0A2P6TZX0_CHLSO|nr:hypothetical protein C2E21_1571 [Chlorella sorokiniana]|eukprot:PRW59609.1 hypothetical protein C2E21_1571 [Chlorella sorokiniana]
MVKIIDGEIIPDDDPRVTGAAPRRPPAASPSRPAPARPGGAPAAPRPQPSLFDWSAPALRLAPNEDGQGIAGLPDLRIFGALMRSTHAALLAAAVLLFGAKGLLGGALLWYLYASNQQAQQAAPQGSQQERLASAQRFISGMFDQGRPGQGGVAPAGPSGPSRGGQQQQDDPWAGRGKPRKLSES